MLRALKFILLFSWLLALAACGDDVAAKAGTDAETPADADAAIAVDAADASTATAQDTLAADSADVGPGSDVTADAVPDADAAATDADVAADVTAAADATDDVPVADGTVADAAADATAAADIAEDADAGSDAWGPCSSGLTCEDGDPCTVDFCWGLSCQHVVIVACTGALTPCDAAHPCASGVCDLTRNACVPCVAASDCGSGYACTANACVPATACKSDVACKANGQVCNKTSGFCADCVQDGDCGKGNQCVLGQCAPAIACTSSKDCPAVCDGGSGKCVDCMESADCAGGKACSPWHVCLPPTCTATTCENGAAFACNTGAWSYGAGIGCSDDNPCTSDACVPAAGCKKTLNTLACDDGNACTVADACTFGACSGALLDCNDQNPCTADTCDPGLGCQHAPAIGPCDDGSACTVLDKCVGGVCGGKAIDCADSNACTVDSCDPGVGCRNLPTAPTPCDDGDACTVGTLCQNGTCSGGSALPCDDGLPCTQDACSSSSGCSHTALDGGSCSDGSACTGGDSCAKGVCVGKNLVCDDGKPCTDDGCDPLTGCTFTANSAACSDGNPCSNPDGCVDGACQGGALVDCDDKNPCTTDTCDGKGGCSHVALADKAACDDGDPCTLLDACQGGACKALAIDCNDSNDCTADACVGGTCKHVNVLGTCDDKNGCTSGDTCAAGVCTPGKAVDCTVDTKGCGSGSCLSTGSQTFSCTVQNQPDGTTCNADNNGCTVGDACKSGACVAGSAKDCSSANSPDGCLVGTCTSLSASTNSCGTQPASGGTPCNADGNGCTAGDACNGSGKCVAGPQIVCAFDPASCNAGSCMPTGPASYTCVGGAAKPDGTACNLDNSGCTLDTCKGGKCLAGAAPDCSSAATKCATGTCKYSDWTTYSCVPTPITCDDGNPCTDDACALASGCTATANSAICNDNNVCTLSDTCAGGSCTSTTPANCNDGNACTSDGCDPVVGCTATALSCDDGNACTTDACDPQKGCQHTVLSSCVTVSVPYIEPFNCGGGGGWTLGQTAEPGLAWAIDGTPAPPAFLSPSCSLNFNNGTDFACINPLDAVAVSPVINAATLANGSHLAVRFFNAGAYEVSTYDKMSLEISTNTGASWTELLNIPAPPAGVTWVLQTVDLTPYVGKQFQLRFRFWTLDCIANSTVGGFIDDLAVYVSNCGAATPCDDLNGCTSDVCDPLSGTCTFTATTAACSDGNACSSSDACKAGVCVGTTVSCDDANACTLDACDVASGSCSHTAASGTACDDGSPCTAGDVCVGATCVGGANACNDNNPCTQDFCAVVNAVASCSTKPLPDFTLCNDNNPCTGPDFCASGVCGGANTCGFSTVYSESFGCGASNGWTLQMVSKTLGWAVDATPAVPGYYSASCSLNFNDGTTYGSTVPASATATSPNFTLPNKATACKLSLFSWGQIGVFNGENRVVALVDAGSKQDLATLTLTNTQDSSVWTSVQLDCMAALGHTAQVQLRFTDVTGMLPFPPAGAGWFVDDVQVTVAQ